jgi:hypothetical protein
MSLSHSPSIITNGLSLCLDAANSKSYPGSGTAVNDLVGNNNFTLINSSYYSFDGASLSLNIDRTNYPTAEAGGYIEKVGTTGGLTSLSYLHNDHTTEIWFKADDRDPYDPSNTSGQFENVSGLVLFNGFHSGWYFSSTQYSYTIWGFDGTSNQVNTWSFNDTEEGVWTQLVAVRNGSNIKLYKNGVEKLNSTITAALLAANVSTPSANNIRIGTATGSAPSSFTWWSDITFSNLRMYKKALTASEIQQNFNALKGRFGLT